jgi:hypothetical protein
MDEVRGEVVWLVVVGVGMMKRRKHEEIGNFSTF